MAYAVFGKELNPCWEVVKNGLICSLEGFKGVYETVLMIMRRGGKLKKVMEEEVGKV
jgi:hypothetical protein